MDSVLNSFSSNLAKSGRDRSIPLVEEPVAHLLASLASSQEVKRVLEIGTAIGFSTLWLAYGMGLNPNPQESDYFFKEPTHPQAYEIYNSYHREGAGVPLPDDARIVTVDVDVRRIVEAQGVLDRCGLVKDVAAILGDGAEVIGRLNAPFQLIFLDGGKSENSRYLDAILERKILSENGILLVDNIFFRDEIVTPRYQRIRQVIGEFLSRMERDSNWRSIVLDIGDGVLLSKFNPY